MGIVKGLANINRTIDAEEAKYSGSGSTDDAPKTKWFNIKDKQAFKVAFLQELDPDSENYSQKNGLGFIAVEHQNPANFKIKGLCTDDEGACLGCEKHNENWKAGWKQKLKLYINVLVDNGVDEPFVAVLSQGNGPKSVTPALIELAGEYGTVTDKWYKIKRTGQGQTDTSYLLTPLSSHGLDVEAYELFDLDSVVRHIPYDEQDKFYFRDEASTEPAAEAAASTRKENTASSVNSEW